MIGSGSGLCSCLSVPDPACLGCEQDEPQRSQEHGNESRRMRQRSGRGWRGRRKRRGLRLGREARSDVARDSRYRMVAQSALATAIRHASRGDRGRPQAQGGLRRAPGSRGAGLSSGAVARCPGAGPCGLEGPGHKPARARQGRRGRRSHAGSRARARPRSDVPPARSRAARARRRGSRSDPLSRAHMLPFFAHPGRESGQSEIPLALFIGTIQG